MFQEIAEQLYFSGILDEACEKQKQRLSKDSEWVIEKWTHAKDIVQAFVHGVISADPWHLGYKLPPDFDSVVNWIAFCSQKHFNNEEVVKVSLLQLENLFWEWAPQHPAFTKWNETDKIIGIVTRYDCILNERDFIDLDALVRNAAVYLRDQRRKNDC